MPSPSSSTTQTSTTMGQNYDNAGNPRNNENIEVELFESDMNSTIQFDDEVDRLDAALEICIDVQSDIADVLQIVRDLNVRYNPEWIVHSYNECVSDLQNASHDNSSSDDDLLDDSSSTLDSIASSSSENDVVGCKIVRLAAGMPNDVIASVKAGEENFGERRSTVVLNLAILNSPTEMGTNGPVVFEAEISEEDMRSPKDYSDLLNLAMELSLDIDSFHDSIDYDNLYNTMLDEIKMSNQDVTSEGSWNESSLSPIDNENSDNDWTELVEEIKNIGLASGNEILADVEGVTNAWMGLAPYLPLYENPGLIDQVLELIKPNNEKNNSIPEEPLEDIPSDSRETQAYVVSLAKELFTHYDSKSSKSKSNGRNLAIVKSRVTRKRKASSDPITDRTHLLHTMIPRSNSADIIWTDGNETDGDDDDGDWVGSKLPLSARTSRELISHSSYVNCRFIKMKRGVEVCIITVKNCEKIVNRQKGFSHMDYGESDDKGHVCKH